MTVDHDAHIRAMRDFLEADRDDGIVRYQQLADQAATRGDEWRRRFYQEFADDQRSIRFAWEDEPLG